MEQQSLLSGEQAPPPREKTQCSRCKAPVFFSKTNKGARGIYDWEPDPDGRTVLDANGIARVLKAGEQNDTAGPRYTSHFVSCPFASEFRS